MTPYLALRPRRQRARHPCRPAARSPGHEAGGRPGLRALMANTPCVPPHGRRPFAECPMDKKEIR
jgi:hypothetical protein